MREPVHLAVWCGDCCPGETQACLLRPGTRAYTMCIVCDILVLCDACAVRPWCCAAPVLCGAVVFWACAGWGAREIDR